MKIRESPPTPTQSGTLNGKQQFIQSCIDTYEETWRCLGFVCLLFQWQLCARTDTQTSRGDRSTLGEPSEKEHETNVSDKLQFEFFLRFAFAFAAVHCRCPAIHYQNRTTRLPCESSPFSEPD